MYTYKNKYLKYKNKYTNLKNELYGGTTLNEEAIEKDIMINIIDFVNTNLENNPIKTYINIVIDKNKPIITIKDKPDKLILWNDIKKAEEEKLRAFYNFRLEIVDFIINKLFEKYNCNNKSDNNIECSKNASGSTGEQANLKSDYDLTISNPNISDPTTTSKNILEHSKNIQSNMYTSTMIRIFNSIISKIFGNQPADVFDTNIYGYSGMLPVIDNININNENNIYYKIKNKFNSPWVEVCFSNKKFYILNVSDKYDISINTNQYNWALLRLKTHIEHLSSTDTELINIIDITKKYINYDNIYQSKWYKNLGIKSINDKLVTELNKLYIERMNILEYNFNFNSTDNLNNLSGNKLKEQIINNLSFMNYYGNETYFTLGAFMHVVGTQFYYNNIYDNKLYNNYNMHFTKAELDFVNFTQLNHSMIENYSYYIHTNDIIKGVKYFGRFIHSFYLYQIKQFNKPINNKLLLLTKIIKDNIRNKSIDEIKLYLLKINKDSDLSTITKDININKNIIDILKQNINNFIKDNNYSFEKLKLDINDNDKIYIVKFMLHLLYLCDKKSLIHYES